MSEANEAGTPQVETEKTNQVYGISGISEQNFREGYNPQTGIFDKSKTRMSEQGYINYNRIGDPEQAKLVLMEGKVVRAKPAYIGLETTVEGSETVWDFDASEGLLSATGYALDSAKEASDKQGIKTQPLVFVFKIGNHTVEGRNYLSDKAIGESNSNFASNSDYSEGFGYHLKPGIVKVEKILRVEELDDAEDISYAKPFRLMDVTQEYNG